MNLKTSKTVLRGKNMNPNYIKYNGHCSLISWHVKYIVAFGLDKKVSCE